MGRWFLPDTPDVVGMLCSQVETTHEGMVAFAAWARGDAAQADTVRELEHRADDEKRALWRALRTAFVTPLDAEDLFVLSAGLDELLNGVKDTTREAEVMSIAPDDALAEMADLLVEGVDHLRDAFQALNEKDDDVAATAAADAAVKCVRLIERVYRRAMPALFEHAELKEALGRRELYWRLVAVSEQMRAIAERVWYAVVKEA
jgi:uncharacterized protein Yka (UPF0111/DUF47 family)